MAVRNLTSAPPAQSDTLRQVLDLWRTEFADATIGPDDDYFSLGGDSLLALELLKRVREDIYDVDFSPTALIHCPTPRRLAALIDRAADRSEADLESLSVGLIPLRESPRSSKAPLICIHAIDGGVMFYRQLVEQLPDDRDYYAIEASATDGPANEDITAIARRYLARIKAELPHGPYLLAGYSFGALIAHEISRLAVESGDKVEGLILYDMFNPAETRIRPVVGRLVHCWRQNSDQGLIRAAWKLAARMGSLAGWMLRHQAERLWLHPSLLDPAHRRRIAIRRKNEGLIRDCRPGVYGGRTLILATEENTDKFECSDQLGWENILTGEFGVHRVTGNHLQIFEKPHLSLTSGYTRRFLAGEAVE